MKQLTASDLIIRPVVTEKSKCSQELNQYTFVVHQSANKIQIKGAIEKLFNVDVSRVNITKKPYKNRVFKGKKGIKKGCKKAVILLKSNQQIELGV